MNKDFGVHPIVMLDISEIRKFGNIELLARQLVEGFITGLHKSPYHGFSVEFAEHRLYNTGESTRHLDWKVLARTDKLFVKRYEEETNLRAAILLDVSSSMYYPQPTHNKIAFGIMAAATLGYMLQKQRDAVGLFTFAEELMSQTAVKSSQSHLRQLFIQLQGLLDSTPPKQQRTTATPVIHQMAARLHRRSLVILLSDLLETESDISSLLAALQHLKHRQHEVLLFHIQDQSTEQDFAFSERPHRFIDLETGQSLKLRPAEIRAEYQQKVKERMEEIKLRCGNYKIDLIEVDAQKDIRQVLMPYLIKRTRMR
ncbi:MAG: DUF58 domain-containing protein [Bernardetiaceae bacterium]